MRAARAKDYRLWAVGQSESQRSCAFRIRTTAYSLKPTAYLQRGVTLIELVLSIVIIALAVSAVLGVLRLLSTSSAEAMIRNQAVALATAYLEEVRSKDFATNGVSEARGLKGDINDYDGLVDVGARDQFNTAIAGLGQYTVTVTVGAGVMGPLNGAVIRRIDVNVQHPTGVNMTLSGYRTQL